MPHRSVHISDELAALDQLERDIRRPPKRKFMVILPVFLTLIVATGATAIAWYSYTTGIREGSEGAAPLLKPQGPVKVTPESPGGLAIPHQDKTVFQAMEGRRTDERIERLLPPPETPAPLPTRLSKPSAQGSSKVRQAERLESPSGDKEVTSGPIRLTPGAGKSRSSVPSITKTAPAPPPAPKALGDQPGSVTMPAPMPKPATAKPKPAPAKKKAAVARADPRMKPGTRPRSGYGVQIGSLSSRSNASEFWDAHKGTHKDLLGALSLVVQTVTVKGKTFHRVQGAPLKSRKAAGELCGALKKRGIGCVIVHFGK